MAIVMPFAACDYVAAALWKIDAKSREETMIEGTIVAVSSDGTLPI
jgi:hypothetical protein